MRKKQAARETAKTKKKQPVNKTGQLSSKEDEEDFREALLRFIVKQYPNPDRIGCPDPQILRDIVFRRKVAPEIIRGITSHITKCAECVWDMLDYEEEYKKTKEK